MEVSTYYLNKTNGLKRKVNLLQRQLKAIEEKINSKKTSRDEFLAQMKYVNFFSDDASKYDAMNKKLKKYDDQLRLLYIAKERYEYNIDSINKELSLLEERLRDEVTFNELTR